MVPLRTLIDTEPILGPAAINRYNFPGQWGTHVDPPVHFVEGLRNLEDISLSEKKNQFKNIR